jgi:hypothetical protein
MQASLPISKQSAWNAPQVEAFFIEPEHPHAYRSHG